MTRRINHSTLVPVKSSEHVDTGRRRLLQAAGLGTSVALIGGSGLLASPTAGAIETRADIVIVEYRKYKPPIC